jgi:hypothetical protein
MRGLKIYSFQVPLIADLAQIQIVWRNPAATQNFPSELERSAVDVAKELIQSPSKQ